MDWDWRLFLDYLDVLAWPVVVLAVVIVFRGRLRELMGRITQAEGAGFRAQFAEARAKAEIENQESTAPAVTVQPEGIASPPGQQSGQVARLETITIRATELPDLVDAFHLLEAYDEVVIDTRRMSGDIQRTAAGMWALGIGMASVGRYEAVEHPDGDFIALRHYKGGTD